MTAHDPAIVAAVDRAVELLRSAAARAHAGRPFNGALFNAWEAIDALLLPVEEADHAARVAELHAAGWQPVHCSRSLRPNPDGSANRPWSITDDATGEVLASGYGDVDAYSDGVAAAWQPNWVDLGNVIFEDDDDTVAVIEAMIGDHDPDDDPAA